MTDSIVDNGLRLIAAAFAEAERRGWRGLTIPSLAKRAGLTVGEAYKVAPDMASLLDVYAGRLDAEVAQELGLQPSTGPWRERVFDAFMLRFDAMLKDRDALRVIFIDDSRDVVALPRALMRARRSMARMLDAAALSDDALVARAASLALVPLYARIFKVWLKDEPDQAKTMAALDKALRRIERWLARTAPARHRFQPEAGESEPTPEPGSTAPATETKH
jgi:AcrR family transcriptional regulator